MLQDAGGDSGTSGGLRPADPRPDEQLDTLKLIIPLLFLFCSFSILTFELSEFMRFPWPSSVSVRLPTPSDSKTEGTRTYTNCRTPDFPNS